MEHEDLKDLIGLLKDTDITEIQVEKEGVKIKIKREKYFAHLEAPHPTAAERKVVKEETLAQLASELETNLLTVASPIVGTFYRAPAPDGVDVARQRDVQLDDVRLQLVDMPQAREPGSRVVHGEDPRDRLGLSMSYIMVIYRMIDLARIEGFDWDSGNARKSAEKHGVDPSETEQVFFNVPLLLSEDTRHSVAEVRFRALGKTDRNRLLHVSFTLRSVGRLIRVISARDMSRKERVIYGQEA